MIWRFGICISGSIDALKLSRRVIMYFKSQVDERVISSYDALIKVDTYIHGNWDHEASSKRWRLERFTTQLSKPDLDILLNNTLRAPSVGGGCVIPITVPYSVSAKLAWKIGRGKFQCCIISLFQTLYNIIQIHRFKLLALLAVIINSRSFYVMVCQFKRCLIFKVYSIIRPLLTIN